MNVNKGLDNIQAMMFDLDGTLIDSIPTYFDIMDTILDTVGLPRAPKEQVAEFMTAGLDALKKIIPEEMMDRKEELIQECITVGRKEFRNRFTHEVELFDGVSELFSRLAERNISIGVVTTTQRQVIERKLAPLARKYIKDALDAVVTVEDAPRRKPAPDPLIECARRLNVSPERCVYVGDSHVDIRAGNAAGMMTIGVLTGLDDDKTLQREKPSLILDSVDDIRELFSSER